MRSCRSMTVALSPSGTRIAVSSARGAAFEAELVAELSATELGWSPWEAVYRSVRCRMTCQPCRSRARISWAPETTGRRGVTRAAAACGARRRSRVGGLPRVGPRRTAWSASRAFGGFLERAALRVEAGEVGGVHVVAALLLGFEDELDLPRLRHTRRNGACL